jgi:hypothetical protein
MRAVDKADPETAFFTGSPSVFWDLDKTKKIHPLEILTLCMSKSQMKLLAHNVL